MIGRFPFGTPITYYAPGTATAISSITYDSTNNRIAYCQGSSVGIIDATTLAVITNVTTASTASQIIYDSANNRFFVSVETSPATIYIIDGTTYALTNSGISTSLATVRGFSFDYTNDKFFVSSFGTSKIEIFKISDLSHITSIAVTGCIGIVYDTSGKLYIARGSNKVVDVYETTTYTKTGSISGTTGTITFSEAYSLTQDSDNDLLLTTSRSENKIILLRKSTLQAIAVCGINALYTCVVGAKIFITLNGSSSSYIAIMDKFF